MDAFKTTLGIFRQQILSCCLSRATLSGLGPRESTPFTSSLPWSPHYHLKWVYSLVMLSGYPYLHLAYQRRSSKAVPSGLVAAITQPNFMPHLTPTMGFWKAAALHSGLHCNESGAPQCPRAVPTVFQTCSFNLLLRGIVYLVYPE